MKKEKGFIRVYTRKVDKVSYPEGLAYSIHMAISWDVGHGEGIPAKEFQPLNKNYGILFARAQIRQDDTICPKGVEKPKIFALEEGGYGIAARRIEESGERDESAEGMLLLWKTKDFISFDDVGLAAINEIYTRASDHLEIDGEILARAEEYWNPVFNTEILVPECAELHSAEELDNIKATAVYSDGSSVSKRIVWEMDGVDFSVPGVYEVSG